MSKKLIFGKKQVFEQFFGGENMSKKMSSRPSRVYTGFEQKDEQPSFRVSIQIFIGKKLFNGFFFK